MRKYGCSGVVVLEESLGASNRKGQKRLGNSLVNCSYFKDRSNIHVEYHSALFSILLSDEDPGSLHGDSVSVVPVLREYEMTKLQGHWDWQSWKRDSGCQSPTLVVQGLSYVKVVEVVSSCLDSKTSVSMISQDPEAGDVQDESKV